MPPLSSHTSGAAPAGSAQLGARKRPRRAGGAGGGDNNRGGIAGELREAGAARADGAMAAVRGAKKRVDRSRLSFEEPEDDA